jgi:hypothetical protein
MVDVRRPLIAAAILMVPVLAAAQQQTPSRRSGWPCGARLDASYFQIAEGTGGRLVLLAPEEISDSATLLTAFESHPHTIFRLAGSVTPGLHEFRVPIDSSVESVVFSISVQCLQLAEVVRPSGTPVGGAGNDDVTDMSNFRAERLVIVKRPEAGIWTVRVAGSGIAGVIVQARSGIGIEDFQFARAPDAAFGAIPAAGVENAVRIRLSGRVADVRASLVSGVLEPIVRLPLAVGETEGSYESRFTPGAQAFRLLIVGTDRDGFAFQRMYAPLIAPMR